ALGRDRCRAYSTRRMGSNLLAVLVHEEVRHRDRIVAIDDDAVLMTPYASRLPFQMLLAPRRPRLSFQDDGPTGAALLRDGLSRLARRPGAGPAVHPWVRTAPRRAHPYC